MITCGVMSVNQMIDLPIIIIIIITIIDIDTISENGRNIYE